MDNNPKRFMLGKRAVSWMIVGFAVVLSYVLLQNFGKVLTFLQSMFAIISPFLWGIAIAYLLGLLMLWLERRLFKNMQRKRLKRALSLTLTLIIALAALTGFFFLMIPQLVRSVSSLIASASGYLDNFEETLMGWAAKIGISEATVHSLIGSWENIVNSALIWVRNRIPDIINAGVRVGSGLVNFVVALFVAIYVLIDLERLMRQVKIITLALFGEKRYKTLDMVRTRSHRAFGGFLVGKSLDSLIIGVVCFIFMLLLGMDYAVLISVIIGVTNVIPTFGPFIGAIPSIFILLIINPVDALIFTIFIIVLQQIDGNILGPAILGDKLGLSALWILFSVVFFGALWGVVGMIIGVPLFSVIYDLFGEFVKKRLKKKNLDPDSLQPAEAAASEPPAPPEN